MNERVMGYYCQKCGQRYEVKLEKPYVLCPVCGSNLRKW